MKSRIFKIALVINLIFIVTFNLLNINTVDAAEYNNISDYFISESSYEEEMSENVDKYLKDIEQSGYFTGVDDEQIYYEMYKVKESKGSIVISHGYSEYLKRYRELIYYFNNMGYSVYGLEHRGHGNSGTLGVEDDTQIYVNSFDDYIEDFKTFIDDVVMKNKGENEKLLLFAHSMGGAIGALFLERYPDYFDAAVLNAPMLEIDTGNVPSFIAKIVAKLSSVFGLENKYILGKGPYEEKYDLENSGTSSKARYEYSYENLKEDTYAQRGDGAFKWLKESFKATKEAVSKKNASKVEIPVLLFQAGNDTYVNPGGQEKFAKYAQNCELVKFEDAKHEIYRENDEILTEYLAKLFQFYDEEIKKE